MKNTIILLLTLLGLSACDTYQSPAAPIKTNTSSINSHANNIKIDMATQMSDINAITQKALEVAKQVKNGSIDRTHAADQLNDFRLRRIGNNFIDDDTFSLYRRITVQRENGSLAQSDAQEIMETRLRDWRRRWNKMTSKPQNPAFTNFLLKIYNLPMLGQ